MSPNLFRALWAAVFTACLSSVAFTTASALDSDNPEEENSNPPPWYQPNSILCNWTTDKWGNGSPVCLPNQTSGFPVNPGTGYGGGPNYAATMRKKLQDCEKAKDRNRWPSQRYHLSKKECDRVETLSEVLP